MNKKIYHILGNICSSCLAWMAFFETNVCSILFFGEPERPMQ